MSVGLSELKQGFVKRERLGGGRWKEAFRAVSRLEMADVALLVYKDQEKKTEMVRDFRTLLAIRGTPHSEHVATPREFFFGEDNVCYFVEELLSRSLDKLSPVKAGELFVRIARDLCRGLQCLHAAGLVHRDIKLDNCGLDQSGRAKIFDLGNVTSEDGPVKGTIFTRAPELIACGEKHDKAADVWSLGATLFALRVGKYPFVERHEVAARDQVAVDLREGRLSEKDAADQKAEMDREIANRYKRPEDLFRSVRAALPGSPGDILCDMLAYQPESRPSAAECIERWEGVLLEWINPKGESPIIEDKEAHLMRSLEEYLIAIIDGQIGLTDRQWNEVAHTWGSYGDRWDSLDPAGHARVRDLMEKAKSVRGG